MLLYVKYPNEKQDTHAHIYTHILNVLFYSCMNTKRELMEASQKDLSALIMMSSSISFPYPHSPSHAHKCVTHNITPFNIRASSSKVTRSESGNKLRINKCDVHENKYAHTFFFNMTFYLIGY